MKMPDGLRVLVAAICASLSACGTHRRQPEPPPITNLGYIDLQPGWRIRVVAPILKSSGYKVRLEEVRNENGTITMKTSKDFEGYESDCCEIRRNDGSRHNPAHPLVSIFDLLRNAKYVRLLFLTRSSDRDHDQAVLTASFPEQLNLLTNQVQSDPVENCKTQSESSCIWVPAGVAVRPEKKRGREWVPAV